MISDNSDFAALAKEIGAGLVIPCHYEMFEFNAVSPIRFIQVAQAMNQPYQVLKCGERLSLVTA
jgi:L-ascorbate metabolism protein UlaG (beta-lactamase superfamily)